MPTDKDTLEWYNAHAAGYAGHVRNANESVYHSFYEKPATYSLVPDIAGKTVLSVGCGSGEDSSYLKKLGVARSVGIDLNSGLINIVQSSHPKCDIDM